MGLLKIGIDSIEYNKNIRFDLLRDILNIAHIYIYNRYTFVYI